MQLTMQPPYFVSTYCLADAYRSQPMPVVRLGQSHKTCKIRPFTQRHLKWPDIVVYAGGGRAAARSLETRLIVNDLTGFYQAHVEHQDADPCDSA